MGGKVVKDDSKVTDLVTELLDRAVHWSKRSRMIWLVSEDNQFSFGKVDQEVP